MTVKNSAEDDEIIEAMEQCGMELTDDQKRHIKEQRNKLKRLTDYELSQLRNEVLRLCRVPTAATRTTVRAAATAYLKALERRAAKSSRTINIQEIYENRRAVKN